MFIVIDGIDGSGKGTQLKLVSEYLEKLGKKVKVLDYPRYGEKSAFAVEKYLNGEYGKEVSAKQASIFYALDRFDDYKTYEKDLEKYDYIISNRYVSANIIHQTGKIQDKKERQDFIEWLENLEYNIFGIAQPDLIIFLDVSPQMSNYLIEKKEKREYIRNGKNKDIHEEDINHIKNAYNIANEVVKLKKDWVKIECEKEGKMQSMEEIMNLILREIL